MGLGLEVVLGGLDDLEVLVSHRLMMWEAIHPELHQEIEASRSQTRRWILARMNEGKLIAFLVRSKGKVAGSGCLWLRPEQPRPGLTKLEVPYLMSMYTEQAYRKQGVASRIVQEAIEWSKKHGYERVVLHASEEGRPIYEKFGFTPTREMRLRL